jgi:predicted signal transduction protein with EAL and GGDEF domain
VVLWNARATGGAVAVVVVEVDVVAVGADADGQGVDGLGVDGLGVGVIGPDDLGLAASDALVQTLGARLSAAVRRSDLVARLSDRRFAVVLTGLAAGTAAAEVRDRAVALTAAVAGPVAPCDLRVRAATGTSTFPADGDDLDALLRYAVHRVGGNDLTGDRAQTSISASTRGS